MQHHLYRGNRRTKVQVESTESTPFARRPSHSARRLGFTLLLGALALLTGCGDPPSEEITVYCGRNESLIGQLVKDYETTTRLKVNVRYGKSGELATTLMTEGDKSPADVFISQDIGAMAAVDQAGLLGKLPENSLKSVPAAYRDEDGNFIGLSGRLRTVVYNTDNVKPADLPDTIHGFTDPKWKGRMGWAPLNGSFQLFITAMRELEGEEKTKAWLQGIIANEPKEYPKNTPIVAAAGDGDIDVGFVNHYYLYRLKKERGPDFPAANHYLKGGPGAFMNLASGGVLKSTTKPREAVIFLDFLTTTKAQKYFAEQTYEFPLSDEVKPFGDLPKPSELDTPKIKLSDLSDLKGTLALLEELGLL